MESSLHQVWESAVGNPFKPTIGKDSQFFVGLSLLVAGILLTGLFGLSMCCEVIMAVPMLIPLQIGRSLAYH